MSDLIKRDTIEGGPIGFTGMAKILSEPRVMRPDVELMSTITDNIYVAPCHTHVVAKEYGVSPVGNPFLGAWVFREMQTGKYIDHDHNRNDLFERNNIDILVF